MKSYSMVGEWGGLDKLEDVDEVEMGLRDSVGVVGAACPVDWCCMYNKILIKGYQGLVKIVKF